MMRKLGAIGFVLLVAAAPASAKTVTEDDSGGSVTLKPGATLKVVLEESAPAGYSWETRRKTDAGVLKLVRTRSKSPKCEEEPCPVGGPGTFIAVYKAVEAGRTKVDLLHRRSFEPAKKAIGKFKLSVTVR